MPREAEVEGAVAFSFFLFFSRFPFLSKLGFILAGGWGGYWFASLQVLERERGLVNSFHKLLCNMKVKN